jgi:hypothetical protein
MDSFPAHPDLRAAMNLPDGVDIEFDPPEDEDDISLALLSEDALSDWNSPEEDAAWAHLQPREDTVS